MNVAFLGTPNFAVPTLEAIAAAGHRIAAVYTQPDRPKGRGQELAVSPVKEAALRLGLSVRQPERIRHPEPVAELAELRADVIVVVGYGQILPQTIIDLPRLGVVNVHASLLPRWRGAAPVQWSIASGDAVTGVTTMIIDAGLDTGDILLQAKTPIGAEESSTELNRRLAAMGAELLIETLALLERCECPRTPQDHAAATPARILKKEDGLIDWQRSARAIFNRARGFLPWPGAWTWFRGDRFNVWKCRPVSSSEWIAGEELAPGLLHVVDKRLLAGTGHGVLELLEVQVEGRRRVSAAAFVNGTRMTGDDMLGEHS
ncbi:MAG: methionyl-tRNA formyltransferase [Bryobacteraceae bacterium]|jgi:methionyl-tRNA formyltransferase